MLAREHYQGVDKFTWNRGFYAHRIWFSSSKGSMEEVSVKSRTSNQNQKAMTKSFKGYSSCHCFPNRERMALFQSGTCDPDHGVMSYQIVVDCILDFQKEEQQMRKEEKYKTYFW